MPHALGSILLILLGAGLLAVAWQGYVAGVLPAGAAGSRSYQPDRDHNPLIFHFFLALYLVAGLVLEVWGILALFGAAPTMKLS